MVRKLLSRIFARAGVFEAAGMFSLGHIVLLVMTVYVVIRSLKRSLSLSHEKIRLIIRHIMVVLWMLEIFKIILQFHNGNGSDLNTWVPLYFCSIAMYAGFLSVFGKGIVQRIGDVFLATGGLVGGTLFLLYPSSSLLLYPAYHFLSIHSFFYHGCMVYTGLILLLSQIVKLQMHDLKYYAMYVGFFCVLAWIINIKAGSNLMFISVPFAGTFLDGFYRILKSLYTPVLILGQMFLPFLGMIVLVRYCHDYQSHKSFDVLMHRK